MGAYMIAQRTHDHDLIKSILFHPEIWKTIAEDGQDQTFFDIDTNKNCFVEIKEKETIGLYILHAHNSATLEIHAHILPEHRQKHSIESGRIILKWILDNTGYHKVIAQVPEIYPNVKKFCINNNFKVEGVNRKCYWKDGKLIDQWLLGITKQEIEEFLL
jgi:RimJ/RimL family protein N-acetyltransferase